MKDSRENKVCEDQYGDWIRASLPRGMRKGGIEGVNLGREQIIALSWGEGMKGAGR